MAKDGSTKSKSAADHAQARKAAQLRKKRHKSHGFHQTVAPMSLIDIAIEQRKHQRVVVRTQAFVEAKVTAAKDALNKTGVVIVDREDRDGKAVVRALKDAFRGSDVRWEDQGSKVIFAKAKAVKKPA